MAKINGKKNSVDVLTKKNQMLSFVTFYIYWHKVQITGLTVKVWPRNKKLSVKL